MASPSKKFVLLDGTRPLTGEVVCKGGLLIKPGQKLELVGSNGQIISFSSNGIAIDIKNETTGQYYARFTKD